jgi:berberine-like enzyme
MDPGQTEACISCTRETYDAMKPYFASRRYLSYLGDDESRESMKAAYGPHLTRLQNLKAKYDSSNVFHLNQNILPG